MNTSLGPALDPDDRRLRTESGKKRLTFGFFIWNDRSKSSASESLFYFTSTGRKGVVIILCAHIQYLNQQYPIKVEKRKSSQNKNQNKDDKDVK